MLTPAVMSGSWLPIAISAGRIALAKKMLTTVLSLPVALPPGHSPAAAPDFVPDMAEVIASRSVQLPSASSASSSVLLTVMGFEAVVEGLER